MSGVYLNVSDVPVDVKTEDDFVYICNLSLNYEWKPVYWTKVHGGKAVFKDMGRDIAYMVVSFHNGTLRQLSEPFILNASGGIEWTGVSTDSTTLVLNALRFEHAEDNHGKNTLLKDFKNQHFELFFWNDNQWVSLGTGKYEAGSLIYKNVPAGRMYLLTNPDGGGKERIFTYEDGKQVWW